MVITKQNRQNLHLNIDSFLWIVGLFITMRLLTSLIGAYATWSGEGQFNKEPDPSLPMMEARTVSLENNTQFNRLFINNWYRWDTGWYLKIAAFGRHLNDDSAGVLPLYPMIIQLITTGLNIHYLLAALVISNTSCLISLGLFYYITKDLYHSKTIAHRATMLLITFPTAFFLFAGYAESLYLALVLSFWIFYQNKKWMIAGIFGGLASITRPQGVLLFVPAIVMLLPNDELSIRFSIITLGNFIQKMFFNGWSFIRAKITFPVLFALTMPVASFVFYNVYLKFSGIGIITQSYSKWGTKLVWPWEGLWQAIKYVFVSSMSFTDWVDFSFLLLLIFLVVLIFRQLPPSYSFYSLAMLAIILMGKHQNQLLPGFTRYMLLIFPIFIFLGKRLSNRWCFYLVISTSLILNILFTWAFINWFWVA